MNFFSLYNLFERVFLPCCSRYFFMKIFDINHKTEILFEKKLDFSLYCSFLGLKRLKLPYFATKIKFFFPKSEKYWVPPHNLFTHGFLCFFAQLRPTHKLSWAWVALVLPGVSRKLEAVSRKPSHSLAKPPSSLESWNLAQVSPVGGRWKFHLIFFPNSSHQLSTADNSCWQLMKMKIKLESWNSAQVPTLVYT